jgi:DNA polymerase
MRGKPVEMRGGARLVITIHPSALLRMDDEDAKADAYREFVKDLRMAAKLVTKSAA